MTICIRVDSSTEIGIGHLMRCLTLADTLTAKGAEVAFICRTLPGTLCGHAEVKGYNVYRLPDKPFGGTRRIPPGADEWTEGYRATDAELTAAILKGERNIDWLIVDHYSIDAIWEAGMREFVGNIMVIDDLADRKHDCDLILNQDDIFGDYKSVYDESTPPDCQKLLGPHYALLRSEFHDARCKTKEHDGSIRRIMVSFGGSDPSNETAKVLEALSILRLTDIAVDVVIGPANPHRENIAVMAAGISNVVVHLQAEHMAELMANSDLAIGAGGMTMWERCCVGVPSLVTVTAENQLRIVQSVAKVGAITCLGKAEDLIAEDYLHAMNSLDAGCLARMRVKGMSLVDGEGSQKVAGEMLRRCNIT